MIRSRDPHKPLQTTSSNHLKLLVKFGFWLLGSNKPPQATTSNHTGACHPYATQEWFHPAHDPFTRIEPRGANASLGNLVPQPARQSSVQDHLCQDSRSDEDNARIRIVSFRTSTVPNIEHAIVGVLLLKTT